MFNFEKLEVWKKAVDLCKITFDLTEGMPQKYQFSLGEQLRRASLSIPTNIAEGCGRRFEKEINSFYSIAKGSTYELVSLLEIVRRQRLLSDADHNEMYLKSEEIAKMLSGLLK